MNEVVEDPVCHMKVSTTSFFTEYAGGRYAFCSEQCKKRFLSNPRLYIGYYGRKAPGQEGKQVIKCRRLLLAAPLDAVQAEQVKQALCEMMGVKEVQADKNKIEVEYDLMQATLEQISAKLASVGAELGGGWVERIKLALINNMEEVEISGMQVDNKKCCH